MKNLLNTLMFGGKGGDGLLAEVGLLVLRVWTGLAMLVGHGLGKIQDPSRFIDNAVDGTFPVPLVSGWFAILGETVAPALLTLGILTRPAALWMVAVMAGAAFLVHGNDPWFAAPGRPSKEMAMLFLVPAVCFVLAGSGRTGIDRFLRRK